MPAPTPPEVSSPDITEEVGDHKPKLCWLVKGENGCGFHLNAIQGQPGSFIKEVWSSGSSSPMSTATDGVVKSLHGRHTLRV